MSIAMNLYYTGTDGAARKFAEEMESSGTADLIRAEAGNERYAYFYNCAAEGQVRPAYAGGTLCDGYGGHPGYRQKVYCFRLKIPNHMTT